MQTFISEDKRHEGAVNFVTFSEDGNVMVTASTDGYVRLKRRNDLQLTEGGYDTVRVCWTMHIYN
jgi:hypothetical protein